MENYTGDLLGIGLGVIASIIFKLLEMGWNAISNRIAAEDSRFLFTFRWLKVHITITILAVSTAISAFFLLDESWKFTVTILLISSLNSLFVMYKRVSSFNKSGIIGIDKELVNGLDYKKSLSLVKSNFKFLGTGGAKLTKLPEFDRAIRSACQSNPVKFLLCHPESKALELIANQASRDVAEYKQNVRASLRIIKRYVDQQMDIQVRFYKADTVNDMPIFRLMFFNSQYCLCSYNIFGNDDQKGEKAPQLHLHAPHNSSGTDSFHIAFSKYFERLWEQSDKFTIAEIELDS